LVNKKVTVLFVNIPEQPRYMLERIDIIPDLIAPDQIFDNFKECITWIKNNVKDEYDSSGAVKA